MENTDNKPHNEENTNTTPQAGTCCSSLFSSREDGSKKPSPLLWAILAVIVIGLLGIASSGKAEQKKADKKSHALTAQLQKSHTEAKSPVAASPQVKIQKENMTTQASKEEATAKKIEGMQEAHRQQMEQAQKAFEILKLAYEKKLNEVVDNLKAEHAAQAQEISNPELNFQLQGVSNVRVQFNKAKDISSIEIIQPGEKKAWKSQNDKEPTASSYPKKVKEQNKYDKGEPKNTGPCANTKCYEAPKWDKKSDQGNWNCNAPGQQSGCW
jgi:hypothetical protein